MPYRRHLLRFRLKQRFAPATSYCYVNLKHKEKYQSRNDNTLYGTFTQQFTDNFRETFFYVKVQEEVNYICQSYSDLKKCPNRRTTRYFYFIVQHTISLESQLKILPRQQLSQKPPLSESRKIKHAPPEQKTTDAHSFGTSPSDWPSAVA